MLRLNLGRSLRQLRSNNLLAHSQYAAYPAFETEEVTSQADLDSKAALNERRTSNRDASSSIHASSPQRYKRALNCELKPGNTSICTAGTDFFTTQERSKTSGYHNFDRSGQESHLFVSTMKGYSCVASSQHPHCALNSALAFSLPLSSRLA